MTPDQLHSIYQALRFYADPVNWQIDGRFDKDRGRRAREVLKLFNAPTEQLAFNASQGQESDL